MLFGLLAFRLRSFGREPLSLCSSPLRCGLLGSFSLSGCLLLPGRSPLGPFCSSLPGCFLIRRNSLSFCLFCLSLLGFSALRGILLRLGPLRLNLHGFLAINGSLLGFSLLRGEILGHLGLADPVLAA